MGSATFETTGRGETADEAFTTAVMNARYQHGHGGYTGSLAEKSGYRSLQCPPGTDPGRYARALLTAMPQGGRVTPPDDLTGLVTPEQFQQDFDVIHDKWGPAGHLELGPGRHLFFGWASS